MFSCLKIPILISIGPSSPFIININMSQFMNTMINQTSLMITNFSSFLQHQVQMKDLFITFILIIILTVIILHHSFLHQKKRYRPRTWPFLGMVPSLIQAVLRHKVYDRITGVLKQHNGTFIFEGPWLCSSLTHIATSDPRNVEYILKTNFSNYIKGHVFTNCLRDFLGDGIFNSDEETWLLQRKTASVEFHSTEFRNMSIESLVELVHSRLIPVFEEKMEKNSSTSTSFDMLEILMRLTFDNVCMISFGVDPRSLSLGLPEIPFARALEDATETVLLRLYTPGFVWKLMRFLNLGREKRLKKSIKHIDEFVQEVISKKTKEMNLLGTDQNNTRKRSDLMDVFMGMKDEQGKPFSNKFLRDICLNFILAGRDSSSVAMSWFFWILDQNPVIEERIVEELCGIVAERDEEDRNDVVFRADEVKRMDYLQAVVSESLRLYPPLPFDRKQVVENDVFPDGTKVKKGMLVLYSIYSMGRMESIWGKGCKEFKPERWLKDGRFVSESPYKFSAFNGGPRSCLGKDLAYYQMKFIAASIIYRYRVKVVKSHPVVPKLALTMYMKYGLKVTLMKRDKSELSNKFKLRPKA